MKKKWSLLLIVFAILASACSGGTIAANEPEPEKGYYYIVGSGADGNPGVRSNPTAIVNYKGKIRMISLENRDIESTVSSLEEACMYGYIDGNRISAKIVTCPSEMANQSK